MRIGGSSIGRAIERLFEKSGLTAESPTRHSCNPEE